MQDAVDDDAEQLLIVGHPQPLGIRAHGVEADEQVATDACGGAVVEGDDIGVVVVLQELTVDAQDLLVIDEDVVNLPHPLSMH